MNPSPKVITGPLCPDNKEACHWGPQGFLAYGCHGYTVIVDPKTLQVIQTVGPQKGNITVVRWSGEDHHHAFATGSTYCLHVACADVTCSVSVWDVSTGQLRAELLDSGTGKPVIDMGWLKGHSESHDLLAVLRVPDTLELWDAFSGVRLWRKVFNERLLSLSLDPFSFSQLLLLCESPQVLLCSDISATKELSDKYAVVTFNDPSPDLSGSRRKVSSGSLPRNSSSLSKMASLATNMILNTPDSSKKRNSEDDLDGISSCLQAVFSPVHQHTAVLLFPGEIHFLCLNVQMTMHVIRLDRASPSLRRIIPCRTVDMLLCLHENGSVSVRVRKQTNTVTGDQRSGDQLDLSYELRCHSDSLRLLRHCKVLNFTCHPITEHQVALVLSDSRVILLDVMATKYCPTQESTMSCRPVYTLSDATQGHMIMPSAAACGKSQERITLQMVVSGLVSGVVPLVTIVTMIPSAFDNTGLAKHVAVGSDLGILQLVNTYSGQVDYEYKLFHSPISGIESLSHNQLLVFSNPEQSSYTQRKIRSEILILNLNSGETSSLYDAQDTKGPILMTKVSPSRMYAVILYRDKPMEFWNVLTKQLVREVVVDTLLKPFYVTWYNLVGLIGKKKEIVDSIGRTKKVTKRVMVEQLFVSGQMSDNSCMVRLSFHDGMLHNEFAFQTDKLFLPQAVSRIEIVCMTWQDHFLVMADRLGQLFIANGKSLQTGGVKIYERRGGSEVLSIQFGPGERNLRFLVHYTDSVYIWELTEEPLTATMLTSSPTLSSLLVSVTWAGPDSVVMATEDSILHVTELGTRLPTSPATPDSVSDDYFHVKDVSMKHRTSPVSKWQLNEVFSPSLMEPKMAFLLKYSLQTSVAPFNEEVQKYFNLIDREIVSYVQSETTSTADRCLTVARLFGDEFDIKFWQLVKYTCPRGKPDTTTLRDISRQYDSSNLFTQINQSESTNSLIDLLTPASDDLDLRGDNQGDNVEFHDNKSSPSDLDISWLQDADVKTYLTSAFGEMMSNSHFKVYETSKLSLHNRRRGSSIQVKDACSRRYIMTGKTDMAVQVLMETDTESDAFRSDCLKACLTSCVQQTSTSLSTIKLAATHMIAAGLLTDGVELLCLIGRHLDACKYLISDGKWGDAVWLAKTSLQETECRDVLMRWAEHLWNNNQKSKAVLIVLSQGQYVTAIQLLCELRQYDTAALFLQACVEQSLVNISEQTDCVNVEFSKLLMVTGYQSAVEHYCHLARSKGDNFLADIQH